MKRQYYVARSDFAFRKYRERIALLQRSDDLRVDVRGVAALRALDGAAGEEDISLYCALSDRSGGTVCLVFRVSQRVTMPIGAAPAEAPAWQRALLARFSRDAAAGRFPVYTAELPAAGEELLLREVSSS